MIDARDLMIGSYILGGINIYKVIGIKENLVDIEWRKGNEILTWEGYELDRYEPIPITAEWLVKFGFNKMTDSMWNLDMGEGIDWRAYYVCNDRMPNVFTLHFSSLQRPTTLDGVHHLQALVWHLERVWLTLTLETTPTT